MFLTYRQINFTQICSMYSSDTNELDQTYWNPIFLRRCIKFPLWKVVIAVSDHLSNVLPF